MTTLRVGWSLAGFELTESVLEFVAVTDSARDFSKKIAFFLLNKLSPRL